MIPLLKQIIEQKRAARERLAALPFARKLEIVEKMRQRSLLIATSPLRRSSTSVHNPLSSDSQPRMDTDGHG